MYSGRGSESAAFGGGNRRAVTGPTLRGGPHSIVMPGARGALLPNTVRDRAETEIASFCQRGIRCAQSAANEASYERVSRAQGAAVAPHHCPSSTNQLSPT